MGSTAIVDGGARADATGRHRLLLWRERARGAGRVLWVLCNPSTADAAVDDPTVRRCVGFAAAWGHRVVEVANLFTLRARDPRVLRTARDPIAPGADAVLAAAAVRADRVVVGWGSAGCRDGRDAAVLGLLVAAGVVPTCLGVNADGTPRHPLYVPRSAVPVPFERVPRTVERESRVSGGAGAPARRRPAGAPRR